MLRSRKPVPIAFMVLSLLYFFYVIGSGSSRMIGDEIGGDPGTMVLPLVLSVFMFLVSTFLFLTDKPQSESRSSELGRDDSSTACPYIHYINCIHFDDADLWDS